MDVAKVILGSVQTLGCNLECDYCYLKQNEHINAKDRKALRYPLETVLKACSKERLGGNAFIEIIGDGETLLPDDIENLICGLIEQGHYVKVITNGTLTGRFHEIVERLKITGAERRLSFLLSLHYCELKRKNMLDVFAENVSYLKKNGISFYVGVTFAPSYFAYVDEIMDYCSKKLEVKPSVSIAREHGNGNQKLMTGTKSEDEYWETGRKFQSLFFERSRQRYYERDVSGQFCYAGRWAFGLDFTTGMYSQCGGDGVCYNFFEHLEEPILLKPMGFSCKQPYCIADYRRKYHLVPENDFSLECSDSLWAREDTGILGIDLALTNQERIEGKEAEQEHVANLKYELLRKRLEFIKIDFSKGDYAGVVDKMQDILAMDLEPRDPNVVGAIVQYGYALLKIGEQQKALDLECCYRELKYNGDYCFLMGNIYLENELAEKAAAAFEAAAQSRSALEEGVTTYLPNYNLGVIYECQGNRQAAEKYYTKCGCYEPAQERLQALNEAFKDGEKVW